MRKQSQQESIRLLLAIILTLGITPVKAGALEWVSLTWVAFCGLTLMVIVIDFKPSSIANNLLRTQLMAFSPVIFFVLFQLWTLSQTFLIALDRTASLNSSLIGVGFTLLLTVWLCSVKHGKAFIWLYLSIISFTIAQSVYGLWIFLSGTNLLLWMPKLYYLDRPTGFFVNANHFAAYLLLSIILVLSKIAVDIEIKRNTRKANHQKNNLFLILLDLVYSPKLIILTLLAITLIASKSIGAIVALSVTLVISAINIIRKSSYKREFLLATTAIFFIFILGILSIDYALIEDEVSGLAHTFTRRYELSKAALTMLQDHWLVGIGGGSFYSQFSQYRTLGIGNTYYNHAHNDLLQFCIEYGLIGASMLLLYLGSVIRDNLMILQSTSPRMQKVFAYASIYSIIAVLVHSLVDFPLHIPGFSALFLVIISINSLYKMNIALFTNADNPKK